MTDTTQPSQAAKALTAKLLGYRDWNDATDYRLTGAEDRKRDETLAEIARFERDTEKRIRESLAGEANVERVAKVLHRYDEPTVGWADPMEVHNAR